MQIVYSSEEAPVSYSKSIFLVGPTPRTADPSWRLAALKHLESIGYDGVVFVPEPRDEWKHDYDDQIDWELRNLERADVIAAWVTRKLDTMPAFTTNVEFGRYLGTNRLLYGRPADAPKNHYLDNLYGRFGDPSESQPYETLESLLEQAVKRLGEGAIREGGERDIPLDVWQTPMFQDWYTAHKAVNNRLDEARVFWNFRARSNFLFSYVLWAKIWIEAEQRHKVNEFVFSRRDISCIVPYWFNLASNGLLDTKIVMVREFRTPVRNSSGFVHELPGGSSFKNVSDPRQIASEELKEETGISIDPERFFEVKSRQAVATLCTHHAHVFAVELTDEEIQAAEKIAASNKSFGVIEDSEKTYVEVKTLGEILDSDHVDWSMIGMIFNGIAEHVNH